MFLSIDESESKSKNIIGATVCSKNNLIELEKQCVNVRLKDKLFGEVKWEKISSQYYDKYINFIDTFLNIKDITFHSVSYNSGADDIYKNKTIYTLIRTICWKINIAKIKDPLCILLDEDCIRGDMAIKMIQEYLKKDRRMYNPIEFLNQGKSHILNISQVTDLLSGAISAKINNTSQKRETINFINYLNLKNGVDIDYYDSVMPQLHDRKIHYFNPQI